jgi:cell shape-determining protein MreD
MGPAFAAVGAGIAALLELTVASRYQMDGAQILQLSLVLAIAVTVVFGFEEGMAWAFVGGLFLDLLALRPLGASVFELLLAVALTTVAEPLLSRSRYIGCIAAVFVITPIFLVISDATTGLLRPPAPPIQITSLVVAAVVNAIAAAVLSLIIIGIKRRSEQRQRVLWWR